MAVSRTHYPSLGAMPQAAIGEYDNLAGEILKLPGINGNLLEAEHGSNAECKAGACVTHAHIHLLPGLFDHRDFLNGELPGLGSLDGLTGLTRITQPYISLRGNLGKVFLFEASSVPTQLIRRRLAAIIGVPDWDWRLSPREDVIAETIRFWKGALKDVEIG